MLLQHLSHELLDNGASRQFILSILIGLGAASALLFRSPQVKLTALTGITAFGLAALAYTVRNPCRPQYYAGCGVNNHQLIALLASFVVLGVGLYLALKEPLQPWGWLLCAYQVYYVNYLMGFLHNYSPLFYLSRMIAVVPLIAAIMAAAHQLRQRYHSAAA